MYIIHTTYLLKSIAAVSYKLVNVNNKQLYVIMLYNIRYNNNNAY